MSLRASRLIAYWSALPHKLIKKYPEQTFFYSTFGVAGALILAYKAYNFHYVTGDKPWYRRYYDVVRPDAEILKTWRKPEEYPAPYLLKSAETV